MNMYYTQITLRLEANLENHTYGTESEPRYINTHQYDEYDDKTDELETWDDGLNPEEEE